MRETGIKIIFQLIPIVRVSVSFSVPSLFHASIQYRAPASAIRFVIHRSLGIFCINMSLSVTALHIQCLADSCPSEVTTITDSETIFLTAFLCRNQDNAITCTRTVKSSRIRTFQYRNALDVIRINVHGSATTVHTTITRCVGCSVVAERNAIHNPQRLVIVCQRRVSTDGNLRRAPQTGSRGIHLKACHLALQGTGYRGVTCLVQFIALQFLNRITQHFLLTFDPQSGYHHFANLLCIFLHGYIQYILAIGLQCFRTVTNV